MKLHKNPILLFFTVFLLWILGNWIFRTSKSEEPPKTEAMKKADPAGSLAQSDLARLWETRDWNQTGLGKLLGTYIPGDLVGWVLWPIAIILFIMLVSWAINLWRGKSSGISIGSLMAVIVIIAACVTAYAILNSNKEATGKTIAAPDVVPDGPPAYMEIGPADSVKTFAPQHRKADGKTAYRMCLKIVAPKIVTDRPEAQNFHFWMEEPGGPRQSNIAEFAPEVKKLLNENKFTQVKIEVTIKTMQLGYNPCRWTAWTGNFTKEAEEADRQRP